MPICKILLQIGIIFLVFALSVHPQEEIYLGSQGLSYEGKSLNSYDNMMTIF